MLANILYYSILINTFIALQKNKKFNQNLLIKKQNKLLQKNYLHGKQKK
tara:strand:- start:3432 stop:3578 length:147 start_codon:yes stop_codon:yes gene_type:complete